MLRVAVHHRLLQRALHYGCRAVDMSSARFCAARCLDISAERSKIALVDEAGGVAIYRLAEGAMGRLIWSGQDATSCAWNARMDELLAFSGDGFLCTKGAGTLVQRQEMQVRRGVLPFIRTFHSMTQRRNSPRSAQGLQSSLSGGCGS